ncbi:MAG: type II secretion system protein GspM [Candidatus Azotimanducaceae bacterium]
MSALILQIRQRIQELERKEKLAILALLVFLSFLTFFLLVWLPIYEYREKQRDSYQRSLDLLLYLQSTEEEARSVKVEGSKRMSGQTLLTKVTRTAKTAGIQPSRLQPEGNDSVSIWFDSVSYRELMLFLERLQSREAIYIIQLSIDKGNQSGKISSRVTVRS